MFVDEFEEGFFMEVIEPSVGLVFFSFIPEFSHTQVLTIILPHLDFLLLSDLPFSTPELRWLICLAHDVRFRN